MGPDTTVGAVRFFYFLADCRNMHPQGCDVPLHGAAPDFFRNIGVRQHTPDIFGEKAKYLIFDLSLIHIFNQTASRILELTNHTFINYIGNYDYYLEKKEALTAAYTYEQGTGTAAAPTLNTSGEPAQAEQPVSSTKLSWQEQKEQQAKERKRKNDLKKTEERIAVLEDRNNEIDELMTHEDVYSNSMRCQELAKEKQNNETELETLYETWEELAE